MQKKFSEMFKMPSGEDYSKIFILVSVLFLLWGFSMGLIDVLNKHFQETLHLTKAQSGFVQFAYYTGYFVMAVPAGLLAKKWGYKGGIIIGLILVAIGSLWAVPATKMASFPVFLGGLFILASGLSFLETVANPYTTVLGPPRFFAARINLAQSCNALGQLLGPLIGGQIILSAVVGQQAESSNLYVPYLGIVAIVILLLVLFIVVKIPDITMLMKKSATEQNKPTSPLNNKPFWKMQHFNMAVLAQFFYMVAQTGIFSFFINYTVKNIPNCSDRTASLYLSLGGLGMFLLGRLGGSMLLRRAKPNIALAFFGLANVILMLLVMLSTSKLGVIALIASFFFMSIMFPTIFALGIFGLEAQTKQASSFLVMMLIGGAFTPIMGRIADLTSMNFGFIVPLICFAIVSLYAVFWEKLRGDLSAHV